MRKNRSAQYNNELSELPCQTQSFETVVKIFVQWC